MPISIYEMDPKEVIKPEHYDDYQQGVTHFFLRELVHLNVNLFIIDHIVKFPFELFKYSSIFLEWFLKISFSQVF